MGNSTSADFYTHFVNTNADRVTYVFTQGRAANDDARDKLARKLGSQKAIKVDAQKGDVGYMTHMRTNTVAGRHAALAFQRSAIRAACVDMWEPFRQSLEQ